MSVYKGVIMEKKPIVSVVMAAFNAAPYLDEAIDSILQQTFTDFELIIINDGSTDDSLALINKWESKDKRIKVFNQDNKGRALSRNRGLELATTQYIAMMDADDIATPNRLQLCFEYLQNHGDVVAVSGQFETVCMYGVQLNISSEPLEHVDIEQSLLQDLGASFIQGASMLRKDVAEKVGGYDSSYELGEDTDLFLRMAMVGKLKNLPEILLHYRKHPESITSADNETLIPKCIQRLNKAWNDRGLTLDNDFVHWLEKIPKTSVQQQLLWWGWNALNKGHVDISRLYAKKLILSLPFSVEKYRFIYCAIRGR